MNVLDVGVISNQTLVRKGLVAQPLSLLLGNLSAVVEGKTVCKASGQINAFKPGIIHGCELFSLCLSCIQYVGLFSPSTRRLLLRDGVEEKPVLRAVCSGAWDASSMKVGPPKIRQAFTRPAGGEGGLVRDDGEGSPNRRQAQTG